MIELDCNGKFQWFNFIKVCIKFYSKKIREKIISQ